MEFRRPPRRKLRRASNAALRADDPARLELGSARGASWRLAYLMPPLAVIILAAVFSGIALQRVVVEGGGPGGPNLVPALSQVFTPEVQHWSAAIERWSAASDLDPNLVAVVMQIELCGDPWALSSSGATGLFQVMPYHFLPTDDPYSADTNATRGLGYLRQSLAAAEGDAGLALAGYNGGIGVINTPEWDWPDETQRYRYWGEGIFDDAEKDGSVSPRLAEWLAAGGSALCSSAAHNLQLEVQP